jgi:S-adenosylmethionine hydrolase
MTAHDDTAGHLVTLTSDFGMRDPYAAAMKGVMLDICPELRLVDLSHEIAAQDVLEGALFLAGALPYFPAGTVHLAVVDPGVGSDRRPIAVRAGGQLIVCPDNGLLTLFTRDHAIEDAREITNPTFMRPDLSATFHGRDLFAPAAARLACGASLAEAGPTVGDLVTLDVPEATREGDAVRGEVLRIDRFGNAVTNISRALLDGGSGRGAAIEVRAGSATLLGLHRTYADVARGEPLTLFESNGYLAIAVNEGDASAVFGIARGSAVEVTLSG